MLWPMVEKITNQYNENYSLILTDTEFIQFYQMLMNNTIMVHDCISDGPNYNPLRISEEPYFVYYFDDVASLFDWLCLQSSTSENTKKLQQFYAYIHYYQQIEALNHSLQYL